MVEEGHTAAYHQRASLLGCSHFYFSLWFHHWSKFIIITLTK